MYSVHTMHPPFKVTVTPIRWRTDGEITVEQHDDHICGAKEKEWIQVQIWPMLEKNEIPEIILDRKMFKHQKKRGCFFSKLLTDDIFGMSFPWKTLSPTARNLVFEGSWRPQWNEKPRFGRLPPMWNVKIKSGPTQMNNTYYSYDIMYNIYIYIYEINIPMMHDNDRKPPNDSSYLANL